MRAPDLYLSDILDALARIEEYTAGMTPEEFARDDKTQSAVIRKFEIVGEASKKVPILSGRNIPTYPGRRWQACGTS